VPESCLSLRNHSLISARTCLSWHLRVLRTTSAKPVSSVPYFSKLRVRGGGKGSDRNLQTKVPVSPFRKGRLAKGRDSTHHHNLGNYGTRSRLPSCTGLHCALSTVIFQIGVTRNSVEEDEM